MLVQALIGTACVDARVALLESDSLAAGAAGLAQLRLREPVAAWRGDRVILRTTAPQATIAGGVVLDPSPARHGGTEEALARLHLLASGDAPSLVRAALGGRAWPLSLQDVAPRGLLDHDAALATLAELVASGEVLQLAGSEPAWLNATRYDELREAARAQLERRAAEHPLEPALPAQAVVPAGPGADALLARLAADGILERDGAHVWRAGARADSTGCERPRPRRCWRRSPTAASRLPTCRRCRPPRALRSASSHALAAALERDGLIVRFGGDLAYTSERFAQARAIVEARCAEQGSITLAELRDDLGASRAYRTGAARASRRRWRHAARRRSSRAAPPLANLPDPPELPLRDFA